MSNSETTTPAFIEDEYDYWFNQLVAALSAVTYGYSEQFTLDEIKEAFAESIKELEEDNN